MAGAGSVPAGNELRHPAHGPSCLDACGVPARTGEGRVRNPASERARLATAVVDCRLRQATRRLVAGTTDANVLRLAPPSFYNHVVSMLNPAS